MRVTAFVPQALNEREGPSFLIGFQEVVGSIHYLNVTATIPVQKWSQKVISGLGSGDARPVRLVGFLEDENNPWTQYLDRQRDGLVVVLRRGAEGVQVVTSLRQTVPVKTTIISYCPSDLLVSQVLRTPRLREQSGAYSCLEFILRSLKLTKDQMKTQKGVVLLFRNSDLADEVASDWSRGRREPEAAAEKKARVHGMSSTGWFSTLSEVLCLTTTGTQLSFRFRQFKYCYKKLTSSSGLDLKVGNTLSAVVLDMVFGVLLTLVLVSYWNPSYHWLDCSMRYTDTVVNELQRLLHMLMEMPAGLKLNRPLNTALGQFFLYHIYLWKTYMAIVKPLFVIIADIIVFCGAFGFTIILSILCDLLSLATIHIYCFYGYAARLHGFQAHGLCALWRLFRGKKWNQLKSRVDSYSYGNDQLFIGSVSFTILLFLLPTVLLYYLVFLVLRLVTLCVQVTLRLIVSRLSVLPVYAICLWATGSHRIAATNYFAIKRSLNNEKQMNVQLKTSCLSVSRLFETNSQKLTNPLCSEPFSWVDFLKAVFWGQIIYPI